ncbi:MAG: DNA polymerase III subunit delta [Candidatus Sedimenticola sp. (ex Thyasira tokunagai)]
MRARLHELGKHLQRGLAPIYLLSGSEPLQMGEAADSIRSQAQAQGYSSREIIDVDARFDWDRLAGEANSLSLFSEQRIIDLRIPSGKLGRDGGKALTEYAARPPEDTLLLITLPKMDRNQSNSKWFKSVEKVGVVVQIWPIEGERLPPWIEQRMRKVGLTPAPDVLPMLAERVEGNLLAAAQEIDKLLLLHGPGIITPEQLAESVSDSARYDVFGLVDTALNGKVAHALRMLNGLHAEGTAPAIVLWALTREIRLLCGLAGEVEKGRSPQQAMAGRRDIWDKRKPLVSRGLQRTKAPHWRKLLLLCGDTDRAIKGQSSDNPWRLMQTITSRMAGVTV